MEDGTPLVIDCGSSTTKVGFAGESVPLAVFPTLIGFPRGRPSWADGADEAALAAEGYKDCYVGHEVDALRGRLRVCYPILSGYVQDWEHMEKVLFHAFFNVLRAVPEDHSVLLTEIPGNNAVLRMKAGEIMFETLQVPALYLANPAVLSLLDSDLRTGLVVHSGEGATHIVPVYEGHPIMHAMGHVGFAGRELTDLFMKMLGELGYSFTTVAEREIVRDMKEKVCYVTQDFQQEMLLSTHEQQSHPTGVVCSDIADDLRKMQLNSNSFMARLPQELMAQIEATVEANPQPQYTLPDGQVICIENQRFRVPEAIFQPSLMGSTSGGLHEMAYEAVLRCDASIRDELLRNVVLSGGSMMFPGMALRMERELKRVAPPEALIKVKVPTNPVFAAWRGGSVLASQSTFGAMCVSRQEYDESGATTVLRKCF